MAFAARFGFWLKNTIMQENRPEGGKFVPMFFALK